MSTPRLDQSVQLGIGRKLFAVLVLGLVASVSGLFIMLTNAPAGASATGTTTASSASESGSASTSSSEGCGSVVEITSVQISSTLSGGNVVVTIAHTGAGCPNMAAATLHVHQNLLASPQAGSNSTHQWNKDFQIGPNFGTTVEFPLMASADGLCFVQVDVHAGTIHKGRFFPTATCTSSTPSQSSSAPASSSVPASSSAPESSSAPASSSVPESSSAPASSSVPESSSVPASSSVAGESSSIPESSAVAAVQTSSPGLASTGALVSVPVLLALVLIAAGFALNRAARGRRH